MRHSHFYFYNNKKKKEQKQKPARCLTFSDKELSLGDLIPVKIQSPFLIATSEGIVVTTNKYSFVFES